MGYYDCGGPVCDGICKHFPGMDLCSIDKPDGHYSRGNDFICPINGNADKMLLFSVSIMSN